MTIDTTNICSHLQKKLFEPEGIYYPVWQAMLDNSRTIAIRKDISEVLLHFINVKSY